MMNQGIMVMHGSVISGMYGIMPVTIKKIPIANPKQDVTINNPLDFV
jgi:hypothetical protein